MAYVSQEKKAELVALAKAVLPSDWKATFSVRNHSTMVCTISQAPASVLADYKANENAPEPYVNHYHLQPNWQGESLKVLEALKAALFTGNHDRSDSMSDYFDVGWYVSINFGKWNKPCKYVA